MDTFQPLLLFLFLGLGMLVVFEIPEKQARFYFESRPLLFKERCACVCVPVESLVVQIHGSLRGTCYVHSDSGVCTGAQLTGS